MNIDEYVVVAVAVFTYLILLMFKGLIPDSMRKYIPLMAGIIGIVANLFLNNWKVSFSIILEGMASGLSATGIDQLIKQSTGYYDLPEAVVSDDGE